MGVPNSLWPVGVVFSPRQSHTASLPLQVFQKCWGAFERGCSRAPLSPVPFPSESFHLGLFSVILCMPHLLLHLLRPLRMMTPQSTLQVCPTSESITPQVIPTPLTVTSPPVLPCVFPQARLNSLLRPCNNALLSASLPILVH